MKKKTNFLIFQFALIGLFLMILFSSKINAQNYRISFEATGGTVTNIDNVMVENLNQGTQLMLKGSEVLLLGAGGINSMSENTETIRVYPNPMLGLAEISFYAKETGYTQIFIYDMNGRVMAQSNALIEKGINNYLVKDLKDGLYVISIIGNSYTYTTKIASLFNTESEAKLTYNGLKNINSGHPIHTIENGTISMEYNSGDLLRLTAHAGDYISEITDVPTGSKTMVFEFTESNTTGTRAWTCGSPFRVYHVAGFVDPVDKVVDYGTVTGIPGEPSKCWITKNLGADTQAGSINDDTEPAAGWYWQFNHRRGYKHDGHHRTPNTSWIVNITDNSDWRQQNDPCRIDLPTGWRIPTMTEWNNVEKKWSDPWNSGLYLHHAGFLGAGNGNLYYRGKVGLYWSSEQLDSNHALFLDFDWGVDVYKNKSYGYPLRCIMEYCMTSEAGPDQKVCDTATLAGNDPTPGTGLWTEESGNPGYYFSDPNKYNSKFTGLAETSYILRWTIDYPGCDITYDDVTIVIIGNVTPANAGPDQTVTGTSTYLQGNTPSIGSGIWTIEAGTGGNVVTPGDPFSQFTGLSGTTYTLRWTISNPCDTSYDDVNITFQSGSGNACYGILNVNYEGQVYNTVAIGTQCWLKENLNVGTRINISQNQTNNNIKEKYCYNNDTNMCAIYGGLYQWDEVMQYTSTPGAQGICPAGWHIPTNSEFSLLSNYLGGNMVSGGALKEAGYTHWQQPNAGATNSSNFTALAAGFVYVDSFAVEHSQELGRWNGLRCSNDYDANQAWDWALVHYAPYFWSPIQDKIFGLSVRCLKN
jgi:uncharacterized protein (TIGR02145 family)